jgi:hypothetical protein
LIEEERAIKWTRREATSDALVLNAGSGRRLNMDDFLQEACLDHGVEMSRPFIFASI